MVCERGRRVNFWQENSQRKVKKNQQMIMALELRSSGARFRPVGEALGVSKTQAFGIVRSAHDELVQHCSPWTRRTLELSRTLPSNEVP
jgi:hypothetical protein